MQPYPNCTDGMGLTSSDSQVVWAWAMIPKSNRVPPLEQFSMTSLGIGGAHLVEPAVIACQMIVEHMPTALDRVGGVKALADVDVVIDLQPLDSIVLHQTGR